MHNIKAHPSKTADTSADQSTDTKRNGFLVTLVPFGRTIMVGDNAISVVDRNIINYNGEPQLIGRLPHTVIKSPTIEVYIKIVRSYGLTLSISAPRSVKIQK
jgi:hypothetical protein